MKAKIFEVLKKQALKNSKDSSFSLKVIPMPQLLKCSNPIIKYEKDSLFYTFDGRALFLSKSQNNFAFSLPEEVKDALIIKAKESIFLITLSISNKLECSVLNEKKQIILKYCINRNVSQIVKTEKTVYFTFSKANLFFISELFFDSRKWIGKQVIGSGVYADDFQLFASCDDLFYLKNKQLYSKSSFKINIICDFIHSELGFFVCGRYTSHVLENIPDGTLSQVPSMKYELSLYDQNWNLIHSLALNLINTPVIRKSRSFIVLYENRRLHVIKIEGDKLAYSNIINTRFPVFSFDVLSMGSTVEIICLSESDSNNENFIENFVSPEVENERNGPSSNLDSNSNVFERGSSKSDKIEDANEIPKNIENKVSVLDSDKHKEIYISSKAEMIDSVDSFPTSEAKDQPNNDSETIIPETDVFTTLASVRSEDPNATKQHRNALLEAVRQSLNNLKSQISNDKEDISESSGEESVQPSNPPTKALNTQHQTLNKKEDRFEKYMKSENNIPNDSSIQSNKINEAKQIPSENVIYSAQKLAKSPMKSNFQQKEKVSEVSSTLSLSGSEQANISVDNLKKIIKETVNSCVEGIKMKNEQMIQDFIIKYLVPCVESAVNEMRIQFICELQKININSQFEPHNSTLAVIKKEFEKGDAENAINMMLKLSEGDLDSGLKLITPGSIECINPSLLILIISKIANLFKTKSKGYYITALYELLVDLEVSELSFENIQKLSVLLRSLRELEFIQNQEEAKELKIWIDVIFKKLKRKSKFN